MCKEVKFRDAEKTLLRNGFKLDRIKGSHHHYVKDNKKVTINLDLNRMVWQRIKKENGLKD